VAEQRKRLLDAMTRAVTACHQALVDYQTGLLDEEQLRRALFSGGILLGDSEAWLLDVATGGWSRYDGIATEPLPAPPADDLLSPRLFDAATLRRWQEGLRGLLPEAEAS
jgi:hypothetical protein